MGELGALGKMCEGRWTWMIIGNQMVNPDTSSCEKIYIWSGMHKHTVYNTQDKIQKTHCINIIYYIRHTSNITKGKIYKNILSKCKTEFPLGFTLFWVSL